MQTEDQNCKLIENAIALSAQTEPLGRCLAR